MRFGDCYSYSQLKQKDVIDKNDKKIGKNLIDIAFNPSLEISHFVVGGGFLEEFLEDIKLKKDVDPVFSADHIDLVENKIKLAVERNELGAVIEGAIPEGNHRLTELEKMTLVDKAGEAIGSIIDVAFYDDNSISFIIGGSAIQEWLERLGVIPDIDLIVPAKEISEVKGDKINLRVSRAELKTTLEEDIKKGKELEKTDFKAVQHKIGLISHQSLK